MTKKDYIRVGNVLRMFATADLSKRNANDVVMELSSRLMREFKDDNSRFDPERFYNYIMNKAV